MDEKLAIKAEKLCRLCLEIRTVFSSIFEHNATEMLEKLTSVKIDIYDSYTTVMCSECFTDLKNAYVIQQRIIRNQKQLVELSEDKSLIKKQIVDNYVCEASEETFSVESKVDVSETLISEIKMEVDKSEEHCDSENPSLIAEADYGHIEESNSEHPNLIPGTDYGHLEDDAEEDEESLIPKRSEEIYKKEYDKLCQWMRANFTKTVTEKVLLEYFSEQSKAGYKASSLWCMFSKLKCMLRIKRNVDIKKFSKLTAYLKKCSVGYAPGQSAVFTKEQLIKFFIRAPDHKYLFMKVVAIFGLFGACRRLEFHNLCIGDIKEENSVLLVHIKNTDTDKSRKFAILNDDSRVNYINLVKKYINLRPENVKVEKFFLSYTAGKCTGNAVGINTFGQVPRSIAKYLKIPNANQYTGHSFRKTSATILADNSGFGARTLERYRKAMLLQKNV